MLDDGFYFIDTGWACGGLTVNAGRVAVPSAPIFKRWTGSPAAGFFRRHVKWSVML